MHCASCGLNVCCLTTGLMATGALLLAVTTDFWLYTTEEVSGIWVNPMNESDFERFNIPVSIHSGLWRLCTEGLEGNNIT